MTRTVSAIVFAVCFGSAVALSTAPTQKDVDGETAKLEKMAILLGNLLKNDKLSHSKISPALKLFTDNLQSVLKESKAMKPVDAMKKLTAARAGVAGLLSELSKQQESLMHEDVEQRESLLMGVLMTNKNAPIEKQLAILKSQDFGGLDVSKDLLKAHDNKTALYVQAAQYLDTHKNAGGVISHRDRAGGVAKMAGALDKRVAALEKAVEVETLRHQQKAAWMSKLVKKGGKEGMMMKAMAKREERSYEKSSAQSKHDIASIKEAAAAIRSGDVKALDHARAALLKSIDALTHKNAGMLVLLQQGSTFMEQDCPYCAAQCVEKCHNKGEPYVACLSECADAGK